MEERWVFMDIMVAFIVACITVAILVSFKIDKTSSQLMLLGIEITVVGTVFIIIFSFSNSITIYCLGIALIVIGLIINIFGFGKKQ